jgi:IS1 family transposase
MYLEGLGFRSIGRLLNCSHVAVYQWIKQYGEKAHLDNMPTTELDVVEMDEMHSSVGSKKNACWLWIAVDRTGKRFINVVIGDRSTDTGQCLWEGVAHHDIGHVMTDYWQPYQLFLPPEIHTQSKAETFTVEGYNSLFRHFLARLRRKSKCYSKSMKMLLYSVTLLMLKRNGKLDAIFN